MKLVKGEKEALLYSRVYREGKAADHVTGRDIVSWRVETSRIFSIELEDGQRLFFTDDSTEYESFQIEPVGIVI